MRHIGRMAAMVGMAAQCLLAACQPLPNEAATVAAQPHIPASKPVTPFTDALSCLDDQMAAIQLNNRIAGQPDTLPITVALVPDATNKILPGLRDMFSTAIVQANETSHFFTLHEGVAISEISTQNPGPLGGVSVIKTELPPNTLEIIGALTQSDRNVQAHQTSAGLGVDSSTMGATQNGDASYFAVDARLVLAGEAQFAVANGMVVQSSSKGVNADLRIGSFGVNFDHEIDRREGAHQAARTLVELSVVELLGRYVHVPYWNCLAIGADNPRVREEIAAWYRDSTPQQRDAYLRARLRSLGYDGVPEPPVSLELFLAGYQRKHGLTPTGLPDFETYAAAMTDQVTAPGSSAAALPAVPPPPEPAGARHMRLDVITTGGAEPVMQLAVQIDRAGFLACYYRDEDDHVWTLFPNRHDSRTHLLSDQRLMIPGHIGEKPVIQPTRLTDGTGFLCVAGGEDARGRLAPRFRGDDLAILGGVGFDELIAEWRRVGGPDIGWQETSRGRPAGRWEMPQ